MNTSRRYNLICILATVLLSILAILSFFVYKLQNDNILRKLYSEYEDAREYNQNTKDLLADFRIAIITSSNLHKCILPTAVSNLIKEKTVILRLSEDICMSCYAQQLNMIDSYFGDNRQLPFYIVASYKSKNHYTTQLNYLKNYTFSTNIPSLYIEELDDCLYPYILIVSEKGEILTFFPILKNEILSLQLFLNQLETE